MEENNNVNVAEILNDFIKKLHDKTSFEKNDENICITFANLDLYIAKNSNKIKELSASLNKLINFLEKEKESKAIQEDLLDKKIKESESEVNILKNDILSVKQSIISANKELKQLTKTSVLDYFYKKKTKNNNEAKNNIYEIQVSLDSKRRTLRHLNRLLMDEITTLNRLIHKKNLYKDLKEEAFKVCNDKIAKNTDKLNSLKSKLDRQIYLKDKLATNYYSALIRIKNYKQIREYLDFTEKKLNSLTEINPKKPEYVVNIFALLNKLSEYKKNINEAFDNISDGIGSNASYTKDLERWKKVICSYNDVIKRFITNKTDYIIKILEENIKLTEIKQLFDRLNALLKQNNKKQLNFNDHILCLGVKFNKFTEELKKDDPNYEYVLKIYENLHNYFNNNNSIILGYKNHLENKIKSLENNSSEKDYFWKNPISYFFRP